MLLCDKLQKRWCFVLLSAVEMTVFYGRKAKEMVLGNTGCSGDDGVFVG